MMNFSDSYLQKIRKIRQAGFFTDFSELSDVEMADRFRQWSFFRDAGEDQSLLELEHLVLEHLVQENATDRVNAESLRDSAIELQTYAILNLDNSRSLQFDAGNFYADAVPLYDFESIVSTMTTVAALSNQRFQPESIEEICEGLIQFTWQEKTYRMAIAGSCDDLVLMATQFNSILKSTGYQYYYINLSPDVQIVMVSETERDELIADTGLGLYDDHWSFEDSYMDEPFYQCIPGEVIAVSDNTVRIKLASDTWTWGTIDVATQVIQSDVQVIGKALDLIFHYHYPTTYDEEQIESPNAIATFEGCSLIQVFPKMESVISYYHPHVIGSIESNDRTESPKPMDGAPTLDVSPTVDLSSLRPIEQSMIRGLIQSNEVTSRKKQSQARGHLELLSRCQQIYYLETGHLTDDIADLGRRNQIKIKELEDYTIKIRLINPQLVQHMAIAQSPSLKSYVLLLVILPPSLDSSMTQSLLCESLESTVEEPADGCWEGLRLIPPNGYQ